MAEQQSFNSQQSHHPQSIAPRDDEVDLTELFAKIWRRKWWVVGITFIVTAIALVYALLAKPTYELRASFRPVLSDQFVEINQSDVIQLDPGAAFDRFRKNLDSKAVRRAVFSNSQINNGFKGAVTETTKDQLFVEFDLRLTLTVPKEKSNQVLVSDANHLSYQHSDPAYGALVVNQLLAAANRQSVEELKREYLHKRDQRVEHLQQKISEKLTLAKERRLSNIEELVELNTLRIKNIQDKLELTRAKALARRYDRVEAIKEAIAIAKALDIVSPTSLTRLTQQSSSVAQMAINTDVSNRDEPLYLRGTKLLSAELTALENRQNDDFTDPAIRELEAELALLKRHREVEMLRAREHDKAFIIDQIGPMMDEIESLSNQQIDFENTTFSRIDQPAIVPEHPIKPKKRLIVAVALLLGGMLGLFVALVLPVRKV